VKREFLLPDETATDALARRAAQHISGATGPLILHLQGELGVGKTCFARGMLRALGETGPVRSPTYGLLSEYETARGRVVHIDLYRLQSAAELSALGLADHFPGSLLWLVEWPEKGFGGVMPAPDATVLLEVHDQGRRLRINSWTTVGADWLSALNVDSA
jgi:tRNA threonylcarbamoyladenosine biosynthesis protein TsaE